ncbi:MAG: hypothetical protein KGJ77_06405 [Acidobacteriota bacterium]|nr:hypothetical protein [Acidobacteriota bacterium]
MPRADRRRWRYLIAAALLVGGLALALGIGLGAGKAKSDQAAGYARVAVPGALTLHVDHPATYVVFSEGTACLDAPNCHGQLYPVTVRVTGPAGDPVSVAPAHGPTYMIGGSEGTGVASFEARSAGTFTVAVSTGPYTEGGIAVGEAFPTWTADWVAWLAMAVLWAGGVIVVVLPLGRAGRAARRAARTSDR